MKIPLIDLKRQYQSIKNEIDKVLKDVVENSSFILGPKVEEFEKNFSKYLGVNYCVGVKSGTNALELSMKILDIKEGDEVITVPNTFIATAEAITNCGADVKFVDVEEDTQVMDVNKIESAITEKTKAIIPVHLYGNCVDMTKLMEIAKKHNLKVIEDCAQAHGAEHNGKKVGSFGDVSCFSFFPAKILGAFGDAGAICTNNKELYDKLFLLRNHGRYTKYEHKIIGTNSRIDTIQAAILNVKLKHLEEWVEKRIKNASLYNELLENVTKLKVNGKCSYYVYTIKSNKRDELMNFLKKNEIASQIYYPLPLHLQEAYKYLNYKEGDFPVSEKLSKEILSLPMFPELTEEEIKYVCEKVNYFCK